MNAKEKELQEIVDRNERAEIDSGVFVYPRELSDLAIQKVIGSRKGDSLANVVLSLFETEEPRYAFTTMVYANTGAFSEPLLRRPGERLPHNKFSSMWWKTITVKPCPRVVITNEKFVILGALDIGIRSSNWDIAFTIEFDEITKVLKKSTTRFQISTEEFDFVFFPDATYCYNRYDAPEGAIEYVAKKANIGGRKKIDSVTHEAQKQLDSNFEYKFDNDDGVRYNIGWGIEDWIDRASEIRDSWEAHNSAKERTPPIEIGDVVKLGVLEIQRQHSGDKQAIGEVESFRLFIKDIPTDLEKGDIIACKVTSFNKGRTSATAMYIQDVK